MFPRNNQSRDETHHSAPERVGAGPEHGVDQPQTRHEEVKQSVDFRRAGRGGRQHRHPDQPADERAERRQQEDYPAAGEAEQRSGRGSRSSSGGWVRRCCNLGGRAVRRGGFFGFVQDGLRGVVVIVGSVLPAIRSSGDGPARGMVQSRPSGLRGERDAHNAQLSEGVIHGWDCLRATRGRGRFSKTSRSTATARSRAAQPTPE